MVSGYTRLTYLESRGNGYVITNLYDDDDFDELYIGINDFASQTGFVFGTDTSVLKGVGVRWYNLTTTANINTYKMFGRKVQGIDGTQQPTGNVYYHFYIDNGTYNCDDSVSTKNMSQTVTIEHKQMVLFGGYDNGSVGMKTSYKLTSFYAKKNGVYVANYIPCKRDSDSALGVYETISDTFIACNGTMYGGYEITETIEPDGTGTISYSVNGNSLTITGEPLDDYEFDHFVVDGQSISTNPYTYSLSGNTDITAYFRTESQWYTINARVHPDDTCGYVTGTGLYGEGSVATLVAHPIQSNPMMFDRWNNSLITISRDSVLKRTVTQNKTYDVYFVACPWTTPITDRSDEDLQQKTSKAYMNRDDWNRIENNCKYLEAYCDLNLPYKFYSYNDIPRIEDVKRIRSNILRVAQVYFPNYELPNINTHYSFFNALEQAELDVYNAIFGD